MCTKAEVKEVIEHEFNSDGGFKDQIIKEVKLNLDAEIGKFARRQIITVILLTITALGAWFSLYYQVQEIDKKTNFHASQQDLNRLEGIVADHSEELKNVATKEDVERIYNAITRIENRLFAN